MFDVIRAIPETYEHIKLDHRNLFRMWLRGNMCPGVIYNINIALSFTVHFCQGLLMRGRYTK